MENNDSDYVMFVFTSPYNVSWGFTGYVDNKGEIKQYILSYDKNGQPIPFRWRFDQNHRVLKIHKEQKDRTGQLAVDYLKNCPECKDSPNSRGVHFFKVMDTEVDAQIALDVTQLKVEAMNIALTIKDQEYQDLLVMVGILTGKEGEKRFRLVDMAQNEPAKFMKAYNDPTRKLRALVRRAVSTGVFEKNGTMILWEGKVFASNEDEAIEKISQEPKLLKAIESNIQKFA